MKYYIKEHGEKRDEALPYLGDELENLRLVAEECAEWDFNNRDGWEYSWPVVYVVIDNYGGEWSFLVQLEATPQFYAKKIGVKNN